MRVLVDSCIAGQVIGKLLLNIFHVGQIIAEDLF